MSLVYLCVNTHQCVAKAQLWKERESVVPIKPKKTAKITQDVNGEPVNNKFYSFFK